MPTLAGILAAVLQVLATVKDIGNRLGVNFAAIAQSIRDLSWYMRYTLFPGINAVLLEAVASIIESLQGDGTDPPTTLPAVGANVTNIYNIVSSGAEDWTYIRNRVDEIWNIVARAYLCQAVVQTNMGNTLYHAPLTISASGTYSVTECDGLMVEVVSVPSSQGVEYADGFLRYPHIGWILGRLPFASWEARSDLVYLGPESHGFAWPGTRYVTEITVFLRPGVTITITPWSDVVTD